MRPRDTIVRRRTCKLHSKPHRLCEQLDELDNGGEATVAVQRVCLLSQPI